MRARRLRRLRDLLFVVRSFGQCAAGDGSGLGIPTQCPFFPVDDIVPASVRNSHGNAFDVCDQPSFNEAWVSTRTVMVTTYIPGVRCP